jgi:Carboxypeptidase regulatory-like domain
MEKTLNGGIPMRCTSIRVIGLVAIALTIASSAFAQTVAVAQLSGTVADESAGALPGVEVNVTQTDTGFTRFVTTDSRGEYFFPGLPVGPYKLVAKLSGFSTFEQSGILLRVGDTRSVNVTLKLGTLSETVTVVADSGLVETRGLSVGTVTPQELIVGLPLNGRSATQLLLLEGGAVDASAGGGATAGNRGFPGQVAISVAGGTPNSTQYLVDGGYNNDPQQNAGNVIPFPDALQEFRTESGVRDARYGMSTGATVNAVTKSGTNAFHGNAFDFMRDHRFNAIRFFEKRENGGLGRDDGLSRNQFGGTIGGPITHDKLFFFLGVQATINDVRPLATDQFVPTAEMLRGDFRRVMSAACRGGTARTLGAPFVGNQVDPSLFNAFSLKILTMVPVADPALDPDGCGRYPLALSDSNKDQQYVSRMDYQLSANKRIFFRDFFAYFKHPPSFDKSKPNLLDATGNGSGNRALQHTIATGLDYVVNQRFLSSTRVAYQHTYAIRENGEGVPTLGSLGVKSFMYTTGAIPGQDMFKLGLWNSGNTGQFYVDTPQVSQDFDWTKGAHAISFGGSWTRPSSDGDGPFQADGQFTFNGLITSGTAQASGGLNLADFLLGYPAAYRLGGSQINNEYVHAVGTYINDVWRIGRLITLNYGLRWEPFLAPKDRNGFVTAFIRDNFDKGIRSVVYPNAPVGLVFKGDQGFPTNNANSVNQYKQFAPRFGLVWDPQGNNTQTIRTGFGIYYDSPKLWTTAHHMLNAPFGNTVDAILPTSCPGQPSKNGCPVNFLDPWSSTPGGDPLAAINYPHMREPVLLPASNAKFPTSGVYVSMPIDAHPMRSYQYDLSYQRQLMSRVLLDVTYIGNQQRHIWIAGYPENPALYIPGNCVRGQYGLTADGPCSNTTTANRQARAILTLLNPKEGALYNVNTGGQTGISQSYTDATGYYNGLRIGLQKRMSSGWSANANYTLSKCINMGDPPTDIGWSIPGQLIDPLTNPHPDASLAEGPCSADRRHLFNLSTVLASRGIGHGVVNIITKDWQVGFIFQSRTGAPLTPAVTNDNALTGEANQRPLIVPGIDPYLADPVWVSNHTQLQWINMAAFANAAPGQRGDTRRGTIYGPGFWNADLAFSRNLNFPGGRRVEIRVEAFNLFDHVNWANPNVTVDSATAGRITNTAGDPRIMQFALKYGF